MPEAPEGEGNCGKVSNEQVDMERFKQIQQARKDVCEGIGNSLDVLFRGQKTLVQKLGFHGFSVDYSISNQDGDTFIFAKFKINKGLTRIEKTFIIDLWHTIAGYEGDESKRTYSQMQELINMC